MSRSFCSAKAGINAEIYRPKAQLKGEIFNNLGLRYRETFKGDIETGRRRDDGQAVTR